MDLQVTERTGFFAVLRGRWASLKCPLVRTPDICRGHPTSGGGPDPFLYPH